MFCPYCGAQTIYNTSFCAHCGKPIISAPNNNEAFPPVQNMAALSAQQYQLQKDATRKTEIGSLRNAIAHFSQKTAQFNAYAEACERVNYYARGAKSSLLAWGCIIASFALLIIAILAETGQSDGIEVISLCFLIPSILMIVGGILMKVNNRKKFEAAKEDYAYLSKELYNHYISCPNCPVGAEYANPEVLKLFLHVLESGRADTVKESINLVIDNRRQDRIQKYLATIAKNTTEINTATHVAAFFAAPNCFF